MSGIPGVILVLMLAVVPASEDFQSYVSLREDLTRARAEKTPLPSFEKIQPTALRLYAEGYSALLAYDWPRSERLLLRSYASARSPYAAAALAEGSSNAGTQSACEEWATRGLVNADDDMPGALRVELLITRGGCRSSSEDGAGNRRDIDEALRVATTAGEEDGRALALRALGSALHNAGDSSGALSALQEAMAIHERLGDDRALALDLYAISYPYQSAHPFADKLPLLDRALALALKVNDRLLAGRIHGTRGATMFLLGRYGAAYRDLEVAEARLKAVGYPQGRAAAAGNLSMLFTELGDYDRAESQGRRAVAFYRQAGKPFGVIQSLGDLGDIAMRRGDTAASLAYHRRAVAFGRKTGDNLFLRVLLRHLGRAHLARREWAEAEAALLESVTLSDDSRDRHNRAASHAALGDLRRLTTRDHDAEQEYVLALSLAEAGGGQAALEVQARHGLGQVFARQGRPDEALVQYRAALDRIERMREATESAEMQRHYFADKHALHVDAIGLLFDLYVRRRSEEHVREAFALVERAKARTLLDALNDRSPHSPVASIEDIAAALQPSDQLVEFILGAPHSYVFTLTADGAPAMYRLPSRAVIETHITRLRELVGRRPPAGQSAAAERDVRKSGQALYQLILAPALGPRPAARRLIIVGDGLLFYTPFAALALPVRGEYVGEHYEIVSAPSAAVLTAMRTRPARPQPMMAFVGFGDPHVGTDSTAGDADPVRALERAGFSLSPLPGSRREVLAIADLFDRNDTRVYTGTSFTWQTVLREIERPSRVVHFATHAIFDEKVPSRSGIVVSRPAGAQDAAPAIIRAQDIAGLQVRADLITLSGCQTGLGQVVDGEGVMGLAWAFSRAGAGSLVVTLWNVSDASTEATMIAFYRALRAGQTKAAALLIARRHLLHGSNPALRHPYYWAGFALIGDPR